MNKYEILSALKSQAVSAYDIRLDATKCGSRTTTETMPAAAGLSLSELQYMFSNGSDYFDASPHRSKRSSRQATSQVAKRDYRTAFDAFGENQLVVWSNAGIPIRICEFR